MVKDITEIKEENLDRLIQKTNFKVGSKGEVAQYIPELKKALPEKTGITIQFPTKKIAAGDHCRSQRDKNGSITDEDRPGDDCFSIQSISKVLALLYVLEEVGEDIVFERVGKEPTGDPFNADPRIKELEGKRMPFNPMINVGAILTTSFFPGESWNDKFNRFFSFVKKICGNPKMIVDEGVYRSEQKTGHNNRSLAWKMNADSIFIAPSEKGGKFSPASKSAKQEVEYIEGVLDNYFRQCSILVTSDDLARAACVLAMGGIDIETGERIAKDHNVTSVISLMSGCGLYDGSGKFAFTQGIPGKSGVGGGIMCVVPRKCGIATFGPPLDTAGNSVKGLFMLEEISRDYNLNIFHKSSSLNDFKIFNTSESLEMLANNAIYGTGGFGDIPSDMKPADYIPELKRAVASNNGIAICFTDGELIHGGNYSAQFSMQSISNIFALLYALNINAEGAVFEHVGKEPTGEPFNKIKWKKLGDGHEIPFNPIINAGAIVVSSMIPLSYEELKKGRRKVMTPNIDGFKFFVRQLCGNSEITIDKAVFNSERRTGFSNRSLAWLMNDKKVFTRILGQEQLQTIDYTVIESILNVYFSICSLKVTCDDLARFGAVLANEGKDLETGKDIIPVHFVSIATSLMASCGLYDGSGEFAFQAGIPSKSGVSGGIVGVVPGKAGIATYSPVVDLKGNSYRGQQIFIKLSEEEKLSIYRGGRI